MDDSLKNKIVEYITKVITKPQKKLGGMPICPYAKKFKNEIDVVVCKNWGQKLDHVCQMLGPLSLEAVVIGGPMMDYDKIERLVAQFNKKYTKRDIEILLMHPDTEDPPLPLEYNFKYSPLIIVQRSSTLVRHRKILENNTKYYNYYK